MAIEPGTTLAHYRLLEKIGEGGMGVVWRALDTNLDREVAIKLLTESFAAESHRMTRFEREAKLLASINHPNVATVYGLHEQDGARFLAMELIPGTTLASRLRGTPLPLVEALSIARQAAAALEATHAKGVIHRDLKPANIYVTPLGEVKVLDFGIARGIEPAAYAEESAEPEPTRPGMILGTVSFMSPEQARGKTVDARTDLWSFGCVLYEMLCGRPAFGGETRWDKLAAVLRQEPDWSAFPDDTPDTVRELVRGCLHKDPERRLASAGEARRILQTAQGLASLSGETPLTGEFPISGETSLPGAMPLPGELPTTGPVTAEARPARSGAAVALIVTAVVLGGAALAIWAISQRRDLRTAGGATADERSRSIAVLPFDNTLGGAENDGFTAGIHDEILNRLAKIGDLKVISRTSVMEYRDSSKNLRQIAEELGVATVLEGSVQRAGDQVRINVQLIDAATDEDLWAESYNRKLTLEQILSIQSDIAEEIATALQARLTEEERQRIGESPTGDLQAYQLYLRGLEYLGRPGQAEENLVEAKRLFGLAIERDPSFALAYAGLSRAARNHYWLGGGDREVQDEAVRAAERAVELAPELPEAHLALGTCFYMTLDYEDALDHLRIAESGLPGNAELMRWKAYIVRRRGGWEEALRDLTRARALDPRDADAALEVGFTLLNLRRYDEAERYFDSALALVPEYASGRIYRALTPALRDGTLESVREAVREIEAAAPIPWKYSHGWQGLLCLREFERAKQFVSATDRVFGQWHDYPVSLLVAWTDRLQGREADARRGFQTALDTLKSDVLGRPEDARLLGALAIAYAGLGRKDDALRAGRRAVELMPIERDAFVGAWQLQDLAWIYVMTGEPEAAIETFDRLLSVPCVWSIELLLLDPRIDPLRDHPAFEELVHKHRRS